MNIRAMLLGLCVSLLLAAGLGVAIHYTASIPWWPATGAMLFASVPAVAIVYTYLVVTRALGHFQVFTKRKDFVGIIDVIIRAVCTLGFAYGLFATFPLLVHIFENRLGGLSIRLVVVALVYAVGYLAHVLKRRNQHVYGSLEVVFGVASAFKVVAQMDFGRVLIYEWAALIGCCYMVTRGMSNMQEANERMPRAVSA